MFGRMVGQLRQGYAIVAVMAVLAIASTDALVWFQSAAAGTVPGSVGAATEGVETRLGVPQSAAFTAAATLTSAGAVNSFLDSYTAAGGGIAMVNMMLGEIAPGGVRSGLYGLLVLAVLTVFLAGLMVGRAGLPGAPGAAGGPARAGVGPTYREQTQYLRQYLTRLRRKLEPDPTRPRHLVTEPGMGYRFQP